MQAPTTGTPHSKVPTLAPTAATHAPTAFPTLSPSHQPSHHTGNDARSTHHPSFSPTIAPTAATQVPTTYPTLVCCLLFALNAPALRCIFTVVCRLPAMPPPRVLLTQPWLQRAAHITLRRSQLLLPPLPHPHIQLCFHPQPQQQDIRPLFLPPGLQHLPKLRPRKDSLMLQPHAHQLLVHLPQLI